LNGTTPQTAISEPHGYEFVERLVTSSTFELFRVRRLTDGATLLLKRATGPAAGSLRQEFRLLRSLAHAVISQPVELIEERGRPAMLLEDFGGEWLEAALTVDPTPWQTALVIARNLADALGRLHEAGVIHQDIRPANWLLESRTSRVCLIDLTLAAYLRQNEPAGDGTPPIPGDWAYVAPEQTGRASHPIDARTDLYCLGLVLYRMLTGRLPFEAHDPVEWAHCHVARTPQSPSALVDGVPQQVAALVMRLLLLSGIAWLVGLTAPVFTLPISAPLNADGHPIFDVAFSWRDLILMAGGLFLLWKATTEIHEKVDPGELESVMDVKPKAIASFGSAIVQILVLDLVFSIDSILTAVGMTEHLPVMIIAVLVAVAVMMLAADPLANFIHNNPTVVMLALGFLLMIGAVLIADGFGVHVPKGYIYAAMAFSALVEGLNMASRKASRAKSGGETLH